MNTERRRPAQAAADDRSSARSVPRLPDQAHTTGQTHGDLPRRPCRVRTCRRTIPYSPGYAPDWTCWVHHPLVVPQVEPPATEAWARRVAELLDQAESRCAA